MEPSCKTEQARTLLTARGNKKPACLIIIIPAELTELAERGEYPPQKNKFSKEPNRSFSSSLQTLSGVRYRLSYWNQFFLKKCIRFRGETGKSSGQENGAQPVPKTALGRSGLKPCLTDNMAQGGSMRCLCNPLGWGAWSEIQSVTMKTCQGGG